MAWFRSKDKAKEEGRDRSREVAAWAEAYLQEKQGGDSPAAVEEGQERTGPVEAPAPEAAEAAATQLGTDPAPAQLGTDPAPADVGEKPTAAGPGEAAAVGTVPVTPAVGTVPVTPRPRVSWFARLRAGLAKTREGLVGRMDRLLAGRAVIDEQTLEELEEILIEADLGVEHSLALIEQLRARVTRKDLRDPGGVKECVRDEMLRILSADGRNLAAVDRGPLAIMVVGVNGVGKTTTIAKLAWRYVQAGREVILAAGDTFRAAAVEQLEIWGQRVGARVVKHASGADPSAVVFDALQAAAARGAAVVLADTAGRLHTKVNLMEELKKMKRVMGKVVPGAPHEVLLVLDANTGQNGLAQARSFHEALGVTGIALTKLDGTAKGGIVAAVEGELGLPVKLVGIGEGIEDLRDFEPGEFVRALFE